MQSKYGYRIMRKTAEGNIVNCNVGAYGFSDEGKAMEAAKEMLEDLGTKGITSYLIQCYSFAVESDEMSA